MLSKENATGRPVPEIRCFPRLEHMEHEKAYYTDNSKEKMRVYKNMYYI